MARAVSRKRSAVSKRVSNGPCKSQWSSSPFGLRASIPNACDFQNLSELSKKMFSSYSLSWIISSLPPCFRYISSVPCRIKEKYSFKLNTKFSTGERGKKTVIVTFLLRYFCGTSLLWLQGPHLPTQMGFLEKEAQRISWHLRWFYNYSKLTQFIYLHDLIVLSANLCDIKMLTLVWAP